MEQLTQMELLEIHELLSAEELALKKCQNYLEQLTDENLESYLQISFQMHQDHLAKLLKLVRRHSGKEEVLK